MNNPKHIILRTLLIAFCLVTIPHPSHGFSGMLGGMKGGGGGRSSVAEILAAGLITGLLMESRPPVGRAMIQTLMLHPMMGGYMMPPRHPMHAMMANSMPMMHPYSMASIHRPRMMRNHALMAHAQAQAQASQHQALAARLNEDIKALEAQESILEAILARHSKGTESSLEDLLREEEDTLPAAALLLETAELVSHEGTLERPQPMPHPEFFEVAASESESRYILPRIVRHFVQRIMRRTEPHQK